MRIFWWRKKPAEKNKILVFVDFDNVFCNLKLDEVSVKMAFERIIRELTTVGEITAVFVFGTFSNIFSHLEEISNNCFYPIICPVIKDKKEPLRDINTTDETIIRFGQNILPQMPNVNCFCLVSGDKDFRPLISKAKQLRKKIIIGVATVDSLANVLIDVADKNPQTGKKMIFFLQDEPKKSP